MALHFLQKIIPTSESAPPESVRLTRPNRISGNFLRHGIHAAGLAIAYHSYPMAAPIAFKVTLLFQEFQ